MEIGNVLVNSVRQASPCDRLDSSVSKSISIKRTVRGSQDYSLALRNQNNYCVFWLACQAENWFCGRCLIGLKSSGTVVESERKVSSRLVIFLPLGG